MWDYGPGDPPAGLVQRLPVHVSLIVLQVVSTEITATDHVAEPESSVEFHKAMTACLESRRRGLSSLRSSVKPRPPPAEFSF